MVTTVRAATNETVRTTVKLSVSATTKDSAETTLGSVLALLLYGHCQDHFIITVRITTKANVKVTVSATTKNSVETTSRTT